MPAAELMYFEGAPLAHVVAYEDHRLELHRRRKAETFFRERHRAGRRWGDAS